MSEQEEFEFEVEVYDLTDDRVEYTVYCYNFMDLCDLIKEQSENNREYKFAHRAGEVIVEIGDSQMVVFSKHEGEALIQELHFALQVYGFDFRHLYEEYSRTIH